MAAVESEGLLLSRRVETLEAKLLDITSGSMAFRVFMKWHLPIFFLVAIGGGLLVPWPGAWIAGNVQYSSKYLIAVIFLCSGLRLKVDDIVQAFRCVAGSLWGIVLILCVTPLLALVLVQIPIAPRELPFGVALFAIMPTTLSSGVILTRAANGNDTLALLLTVVTNLAAIVIIPFTLQILLAVAPTASGSAVRVSIDPLPLLVSLTLCIVVPLALGKVLSIDADCARALCARPCPATAAWCNRACRRAPAVGGSGAEPDADAAEVDSEEEDAAAGAGVTGVLSGSVAVGAADAGAIELVAKDLAEVDGAVAAAVVPTPTAALGVTEAERGDAKCAASAETAGEPAPSPPLMCPRNPVVLGVTATKIPMKLFMSFALACIPWLKVRARVYICTRAPCRRARIRALAQREPRAAPAHRRPVSHPPTPHVLRLDLPRLPCMFLFPRVFPSLSAGERERGED
jgi:hypothetical protein